MASPPTTQPEATPQPPTTTTTTTTKPTPIITTSTPKTAKHYVSKCLPLYTKAFIKDPMFVYPLQHIPWYDRSSSLYRLFSITGSVALAENVTIWESHTANPHDANDTHHCIALIVAPGQKLMNDLSAGTWIKLIKANGKMLFGLLRRAGVGRFLSSADEYYDGCKKAKAMVFAKDEQYYYVSHIATDEKHRGKGLAPALLRGVLAKAQEERRPVWLEASSANSRKVYLKVGFTDVAGEEGMKTGVGKANAEGEYARGKEAVGVTFWPMVWWPEGYKHGKVKESG